MSTADNFPRASHFGVEFPFTEYSVKGSLRHHVHVYLHTPGGEVESLERNLYEIRFSIPFHEVFKKYPKLWPEKLAVLRTYWETGATGPLVIPSIGTIPAKAIDWEQRFVAKVRSGEPVNLTCIEDQANAFLARGIVAPSNATLGVYMQRLDSLAVDEGVETSFFDKLRSGVNSILAIKDSADIYATILDAKLQGVMREAERLDQAVKAFSDPSHWQMVDVLHEVHGTARQIRSDVLGRSVPMDFYSVPRVMSVAQISQALYGSTGRATELLKINSFQDALAVKAGTRARYYVA